MITQSEEKTFREVSDELTVTVGIRSANALASLSSKKRGPGAETLALAQLLLSQTEAAPLRLLGLASTIIESMQRSSGKQWAQVCNWRCSFEVREARERALAHLVKAATSQATYSGPADISEVIAVNECVRALTVVVRTREWPQQSELDVALKGRRKEPAVAGPVDLEHVFNMLVSHLSGSGGHVFLEQLSAFISGVVEYTLKFR